MLFQFTVLLPTQYENTNHVITAKSLALSLWLCLYGSVCMALSVWLSLILPPIADKAYTDAPREALKRSVSRCYLVSYLTLSAIRSSIAPDVINTS